MGVLRRAWGGLLQNLFQSLGLVLGMMQVVIGHWVTVVWAGREGPGPFFGTLLAALLVAANAALIPVLRRARHRGGWPRRLARAYMGVGLATLLLGVAVVLAWVGFVPLEAALGLLGVSGDAAFAGFRVASVPIVGAIAGMLVWGFTLGQSHVDHTHVTVPLRDLPTSLEGLRIVQLSDLHIGNGLEGERLSDLVGRVNRMEPDLVALTGDLFDFDPAYVEDGALRLGGLRARLGVYAVLGNHDTYTGSELVAGSLERHAPGVRLLRGERVRVPGEEPFYVAGIDDPGRHWTARDVEHPGLEALARDLPADGPVLLLVHRPELFPQAARLGFPLVLAGHTHGGQIALPTPGGAYNLARLLTRFSRGLFEEAGSLLYVSRGVGVAGPAIRLNCSREITTLELTSTCVRGRR
jgi:predicted MPP superfamily phosphohydrolase